MEKTFKNIERYFIKEFNLSLYSIRYAIHVKDPNKDNKEWNKLLEKNNFRRIEQSISLIMELYHHKSTQRKLIAL